ncbi:glycoside hydrolase family 5 protein [Amniculicola lignicola CBS 123094]|uniref:Glycoside hydrolase family 5 protein n=1 Tax=Amniculicola lignicola CBS 123094 TaxID=1392246 RepID=A0A6A5WPT3_9PLEO|nr:glycoside hydrolase family 5 protein [Amniculicola lignicola CBS 123094]
MNITSTTVFLSVLSVLTFYYLVRALLDSTMHLSSHVSLLLGCTTLLTTVTTQALSPLHTSSRWILDSANKRFKLRCINWAGHMEAHLPEGLQHQPLTSLSSQISTSGFNCVRLTFSIEMALNPSLLVKDSFATLAERAGADVSAVNNLWTSVQTQNPWIQDLSIGTAWGRIVDELGSKNIRVILDNHVSHASWCCNLDDGNGWWDASVPYIASNSRFFNTSNWLLGLSAMAHFSADHPAVAGIGLRNEIREIPVVQNRGDWYTFVAQGARAVHEANPDLLIAVGGALSSTDASFLRARPFDRSPFGNKVVWEWHQYTFSPPWIASFKNCAIWKSVVGGFTGFLLQENQAYTGPLWLSEFGVGMTGGTPERNGLGEDDYKYLKCLVEYAAGNDGDWALWAIQGDYYVRDGQVNNNEGWGLLNSDWSAWRNPAVKDIIAPLFKVTQGP